MDFTLSEEQNLLIETTKSFVKLLELKVTVACTNCACVLILPNKITKIKMARILPIILFII